MKNIKHFKKSDKEIEAQIKVAAYFLAQKNLPLNDLCWLLAEVQLKVQEGKKDIPESEIRKKAEEIFFSGYSYDEICWLISEFEILIKKKYFSIDYSNF